jgi:HAE1 family hydrophobic/amphiphilic exporter-1
VAVLLFFLRGLSGTLVIAIAIPLSVIACFTLVYFAGYTLNIMSLGGLALGIGMLVDNAIVVLENIVRKRDEQGLDRKRAAIEGTVEVNEAILSSTLTTVVVFLPLLFIAGMSGILFRQLAAVVTFSLFCSYVAAITVVPMLAARFLGRTREDEREHPLHRVAFLDRFLAYRRSSPTPCTPAGGRSRLVFLSSPPAGACPIGIGLLPATDELRCA